MSALVYDRTFGAIASRSARIIGGQRGEHRTQRQARHHPHHHSTINMTPPHQCT